jgi:hypothetical protein
MNIGTGYGSANDPSYAYPGPTSIDARTRAFESYQGYECGESTSPRSAGTMTRLTQPQRSTQAVTGPYLQSRSSNMQSQRWGRLRRNAIVLGSLDALLPEIPSNLPIRGRPRSQPRPPPANLRNYFTVPGSELAADDTLCGICYQPYDFDAGDDHVPIRFHAVCSHTAGKSCLEKWVNSGEGMAHTCPYCRRSLLPCLEPKYQ